MFQVKVMHQILGPAVSFLCAREDTDIFVEFQRTLNEMEIVTSFDLYIRAEEVIDYSVGEFDSVKKEETVPPAIGFLSNKQETAQQFLDWFPQLNAVLVDLDKGTNPYKVSVYIETVPHNFTVEEYSKRMEQILSIENVKGIIFTVEDDVDGNKWELYQFLYAISCLYEQFVCIRMMSDCTIKWIEMFLETLRRYWLDEARDWRNEARDWRSEEMDNQSGKSSLRWTRSTAVRIRVSPKGKSGNSIAAGVLCKINDRVFVATAAHVIMDQKKKCRREVELEQLGNGIITGTNVMIHSEADLALIEVANPRDQEYPVVSNKTGV
jgi:hypothetical protein